MQIITGILEQAPFALITVCGPDAKAFLQGRLSSDVNALKLLQGQPTSILDRKGRLLVWGTVIRLEDAQFTLLVPSALQAQALAELKKFHIVETLTIAHKQNLKALVVLGQGAVTPLAPLLNLNKDLNAPQPNASLALMAQPPNQAAWLSATDSTSPDSPEKIDVASLDAPVAAHGLYISRPYAAFGASAPLGGLLLTGCEAFYTRALEAIRQNASVQRLSPEVFDLAQKELGLLLPGSALPENTLLPETGQEVDTVSYSKGCYLGQETVARVKTHGNLQKKLCGVLIGRSAPEALPPDGATLMLDGQEVGTLLLTFRAVFRDPGVLEMDSEATPFGKKLAGEALYFGAALLAKHAREPGTQIAIAGFKPPARVSAWPVTQPALMANQAAKALLERASALFIQNDVSGAEALLRKALEKNPLYADAYESLGVILGRQERYDEAIALMHDLKTVDPASVMAHTNLSVFYQKLGRIEAAETEKAKATTLAFSNAMAERLQQNAAQARPETEAKTEAKTQANSGANAQSASAPEPNEAALRARLQLFDQALAFAPDDVLALSGKASLLIKLEAHHEALPLLTQLLQKQPDSVPHHVNLAQVQLKLGQAQAAQSTLNQGLKLALQRGDRATANDIEAQLAAMR
ncbi:MAG: tetratricopeptide repeat protein [Vampirovibrionales bacterium]|nr:tetratricopeptide repeat protein [Vampirovibrionales bacterium]